MKWLLLGGSTGIHALWLEGCVISISVLCKDWGEMAALGAEISSKNYWL